MCKYFILYACLTQMLWGDAFTRDCFFFGHFRRSFPCNEHNDPTNVNYIVDAVAHTPFLMPKCLRRNVFGSKLNHWILIDSEQSTGLLLSVWPHVFRRNRNHVASRGMKASSNWRDKSIDEISLCRITSNGLLHSDVLQSVCVCVLYVR